ncbi:MAG: hypothetical protein HY822_02100 [Acidobacteria bacterium]|nr:hypothetical protein [Acidobacteriota bacterium]
MSRGFDLPAGEAGSLRRGRIAYFPVAPGRLEFAAEVRRRILAEPPRIVAVELPGALEPAYRRAVERLPEMTALVYEDGQNEDQAVYVVVEPADPFTEAIRSGLEAGAEVVFIEPDVADRPHVAEHYPDPYAVRRIGIEKYIEAYRVYPAARSEEIAEHASAMAWKLQGADPEAAILVVVSLNLLDALLDAMERPQEEPRSSRRVPLKPYNVHYVNPHPRCLAEITVEYPYLQARYEEYRGAMGDPLPVDRQRAQLSLFRDAEESYRKNTGEKIEHWQRRMMARYTRNLAHLSGDLMAGLFDLTVAARAVVDDNYGWEVWDTANRYPAQRERCELETVSLSGEEVWIHSRKLRLRRRLPRPKQRLRPANLKSRKKEQTPGEWAREVNGNAICSYPPEDLVVEDYGRFLQSKAKSLLSEERVRVEPFTTSLFDGVDLRETIRNWHEKKIFVRRFDRVAGDVGAVVVIFDEDRANRYPYHTTWLGENQNESDMAYYATQPFDHMVGPGIGRAEYGGFLMTLPPRRMVDVWSDPDYSFAETKPERLLLAALDYSVQRHVVYVAARPPRSIFRSIAVQLRRSILYVPIGQLSPARLKRVRVVHVLDSYDRRLVAKDYIW